jgi:hypothetical protein
MRPLIPSDGADIYVYGPGSLPIERQNPTELRRPIHDSQSAPAARAIAR